MLSSLSDFGLIYKNRYGKYPLPFPCWEISYAGWKPGSRRRFRKVNSLIPTLVVLALTSSARVNRFETPGSIIFASSEESVGEGERQGWLSTRNLRSFLQVESARQNATFIFGRERRETGENVGQVKFCCNSASEVEDMKHSREDMKHSRLVGLFVTLLGVLALFSSLNKPGVAALRGSEVLGLIGSGGCFGVGFAGLIGKLRVRD